MQNMHLISSTCFLYLYTYSHPHAHAHAHPYSHSYPTHTKPQQWERQLRRELQRTLACGLQWSCLLSRPPSLNGLWVISVTLSFKGRGMRWLLKFECCRCVEFILLCQHNWVESSQVVLFIQANDSVSYEYVGKWNMCKQLTVIDPSEYKSDNEDDNNHDSYKT